MTLEDVRIEYRPLRLGFCIRDGNIQDLLKAAKLNTLLWGGIFNPIIPIGEKEKLDHVLVKLFQVDVLVPVTNTEEIKKFIEQYKWAKFPLMYHSEAILTEDINEKNKKVVRVLDVSHIIKMLWNKDFKFLKTGDSNCAVVSWKSKDTDRDIFTLMFGSYPKEKFVFRYKQNFKKALRAHEIKLEEGKQIPAKLASSITPLYLTEYKVQNYGGRRISAGIYIGDKNNFADLLNFWNIRAAGSYVAFLPKKNKKRFLPFIKAHAKRIKKPKELYRPSLTIWFRGEKESDYKEIERVIKPLKTKGRTFGLSNVSIHSWNGMNIIPTYNFFNDTTTIASINVKYGKPSVAFQLLDKPFPKSDKREFLHQLFVVSLNPSIGIEFPEYTTSLPVLPDLNEWYAREMVFDPHSLRVVRSYLGKTISLITEIDADTLQFSPIRKFDVIKKIFERAGIIAEKSGAGLVAERLIALMGGVTGSARIFKITGVRKFIEETNPINQKTKYEILKKIRDKTDKGESFKNFENEFGLKGRTPLKPEDVFDELIEHNLLQTGIEVCCPKCSLKTWINLKEVDECYTCEFCHEKSKFVEVVKPINFEGKKIDGARWSYRLSGLLGKNDKQQGAIPVILTLLHLANRMHSGGESFYSTALNLTFTKNGKAMKTETDLVVLDLTERISKEDIEILIGECKTGQLITRKQIDGLVAVKELIEKSGIKCHLVFTKTKGDFRQGEIAQFKRLVQAGIKPLLFTAHELEPWWNEYRYYEKTRKDFQIPIKHPFTFGELAENSVYIYKLKNNEKIVSKLREKNKTKRNKDKK